MNTSSKFIVATHIMATLAGKRIACGPDFATKSEFLSHSVNTNPVVIRRILGSLRKAGLVMSQTGPEGGSRLIDTPEKISLLDIYEAVEEGDLFHLHYNKPNEDCPFGANVQGTLCSIMAEAESAMKAVLAEKTLMDVTQDIMDRSGISKLLAAGYTVAQMQEEFAMKTGKLVKKETT